jgi:hypothetical protein
MTNDEMKERKQRKPKAEPKAVKEEIKPVEFDTIERFPNVKRMLDTLDKFLNRRIVGIIGVYITVMLISGFGLIMSGTVSASTGGSVGVSPLEVWLYSFICVATFIIVLILARVISVKIAKNRGK